MKLTNGPFQKLLAKHLKESDHEVPNFTFENLVTKPHALMLRNESYAALAEELAKMALKEAHKKLGRVSARNKKAPQ